MHTAFITINKMPNLRWFPNSSLRRTSSCLEGEKNVRQANENLCPQEICYQPKSHHHSCERKTVRRLKFTFWRRETYPGSFWRSTLEAPEGCGLSASIFPTTTTKQELGQRIPTRGYYIRIGSWWVVIWRHLELAPMLLIDCELWSFVIGPRKFPSRRR